MSEGTPKAIEPKGIVRNATKIGVQDGQAEDLINLRFVDGSWRASGDGRLVHTMSGTIYQQLYVHTNLYHHLLGVNNGKLYWFAIIENDGTTFTPLSERKELTSVTDDVWITQTGHLLTVIDETDDFEYFIFKLGDQEYAKVITDANGKPDSRKVFPYGNVHFNFQAEWYGGDFNLYDDNQYVKMNSDSINYEESPSCVPKDNESTTYAAAQIWHAKMLEAFKMATDNNCFTGPFLALIAVRLYDGSYVYASNPVLINPREKLSMEENVAYAPKGMYSENGSFKNGMMKFGSDGRWLDDTTHTEYLPVFSSSAAGRNGYQWGENEEHERMFVKVTGHNLLLSIDDLDILRNNKEVFAGIGVFLTRQSHLFYMGASDYRKGKVICHEHIGEHYTGGAAELYMFGNVTYMPGRRTKSEVITDLMNSPFYLLRDYTLDELNGLKENCLVDIRSDAKYKGVLSNITSQKTLQTESTSRATYLPKTSYLYNGRVHIANYKTYPFFGFPIDAFHLHNHSLWPRDGQWWKNTLYNLVSSYDIYFQYPHDELSIQTVNALVKAGAPYYVIRVVIESQQGEQEVVRYLPAYNTSAAPAHTANFIEDLNPVLCYPDARAKRMKISYVRQVYRNAYCEVGRKDYPLKPHPYLNIAYYIDPDLKPIKVNQYYDTVYVDF